VFVALANSWGDTTAICRALVAVSGDRADWGVTGISRPKVGADTDSRCTALSVHTDFAHRLRTIRTGVVCITLTNTRGRTNSLTAAVRQADRRGTVDTTPSRSTGAEVLGVIALSVTRAEFGARGGGAVGTSVLLLAVANAALLIASSMSTASLGAEGSRARISIVSRITETGSIDANTIATALIGANRLLALRATEPSFT
jgi:hypothetical protein